MRVSFVFKSALLLTSIGFVFGCQKESLMNSPTPDNAATVAAKKMEKQTHQLKGEYVGTWDTIVTSPTSAYAYGICEGQVNLLGKSATFYNTYSPNGMHIINAPLTQNDVLSKLLHNYGFTALGDAAVISFDKQGNSILSRLDSGMYTYTEYPPTNPVKINNYYTIINGTGKFMNAEGKYTLTGYWSPDPSHYTYLKVDGEISY